MDVDPEESFLNGEQTPDSLSSVGEEFLEQEVDPVVTAELAKEEGNAKFKVKKYGEAIDLYTKAASESLDCIHSGVCDRS